MNRWKLVLVVLAGCANGPAAPSADEGCTGACDPESVKSPTVPGGGTATTGSDGALGGGPPDSGVAAGPSAVVAIGTGSGHTCVLTGGGVVKCWGVSSYGQIGTGVFTHPSVTTPFTVPGLGFVTAIAVAGHHTCAVEQDGAAKCWGGNELGTIGDGTVVNRLSPTSVLGVAAGGVTFTKLQSGFLRNVALTNGGGVVEWGAFIDGVDVNAATAQTAPIPVAGLTTGVTSVAAGDVHACAVTSLGGVKCWGYNVHGQCGDGSVNNARTSPVDVVGLSSGVKSVAGGNAHTCALLTTGTVKCWGSNPWGELGDGSTIDRPLPVTVAGLTNVVAITAGWHHTCAISSAGGVSCWGANLGGLLGNGTTTASSAPTAAVGLGSGVVAISGSSDHNCALTNAGVVRCWGYNTYGQLGPAVADQSSAVPVDVTGL